MIDFACKKFDLEEVIKCGLGLTKSEFLVMKFFMGKCRSESDTLEVSEKLGLNLTTVQKAVKKLSEKGILIRGQKNLEKGGYVYSYRCSSKNKVREILKDLVHGWADKVEREIDKW